MTSSCLSEVDTLDDALTLTSNGVPSLNTLSQNVVLQNILQKSTGSLKSMSNVFIVAQLRNQKIKI